MTKSIPHDVSLIADPDSSLHSIYSSPILTGSNEITEKDLIDSPWLQRLRYIYQLQSARWVYPAAEHSRFQHSLGAMHLAGQYARHVYPSLAQTVRDVPSLPYVEALLRITALLHDVGHGPFCHFFDHHFLHRYGLSHEHVSQAIIRHEVGPQIKQVRRSPSGTLADHETLDPEYVAFLILKKPRQAETTLSQVAATASTVNRRTVHGG